MSPIKALLALAIASQLTACGWGHRLATATAEVFYPPIKTLHLDITARASSNTDPSHMGALAVPTVVRVYQLADAARFERASYDALLDASERALGDDRLDEHSLVIKPGEGAPLDAPLAEGARFVGVVGLFRQPQEAAGAWRLLVPRDQLSRNQARRVIVADNRLALQPPEED